MPKFPVDSITVTPDDFLESCSRSDIDVLIETLREDWSEELARDIRLSPEKFLDRCSTGERYQTLNLLQDDYDIGNEKDEEVRSESQRQFNHHLSCLKNAWYSVGREDADIIAILAKKYGAV